jgi:hypothetical protein
MSPDFRCSVWSAAARCSFSLHSLLWTTVRNLTNVKLAVWQQAACTKAAAGCRIPKRQGPTLLYVCLHAFSSPLMQFDWHKLQQSLDHNIRSHTLAGGCKCRHDAMAQHRLGHGFHVIRCDMKSSLQQRMRSRAEYQILSGSRTCTPGNQFLDERWRF